MNDPILMAAKLEQLAYLARDAGNEFEKAAVFAAANAIAAAFEEDEDSYSDYALENVEKARWSISAAVGYDITNGHDRSQHVVFALGAAGNLKSFLEQAKR
jgi:hypothetical protein